MGNLNPGALSVFGTSHHSPTTEQKTNGDHEDAEATRAASFESFILPELVDESGLHARFFRERITAYRDIKDFTLLYSRKQDLGEGMTGHVIKVVDRHAQERASKFLYGHDETARAQCKELRREIAFLRTLDHPNILKVVNCFEDSAVGSVQVVTEMCKGGSLASPSGKARMNNNERNIACVLYQVLLALQFLHNRGIAHRDIKEENIMFTSPDRSSLCVTLIDFGLASFVGQKGTVDEVRRLHTFCGTLPYISPDVLKASYSLQTDLWSVGVLAFELLTGELPFHGSTDRALMKQIQKAKIDYTAKCWTKLSPDALDLVQHLLVSDPMKRWGASFALKSPWFKQSHLMVEDLPVEIESKMVKSIRDFMSHCETAKLVLMIAAHFQLRMLDNKAQEDISKAFHSLDLDSDGVLTGDEFAYLLEKHGATDQQSLVLSKVDYEGVGMVTWTNFVGMTLQAFKVMDDVTLSATFDYVSHGRRKVPIEELERLVPKARREQLVAELRGLDADNDGCLEKSELVGAARASLMV